MEKQTKREERGGGGKQSKINEQLLYARGRTINIEYNIDLIILYKYDSRLTAEPKC